MAWLIVTGMMVGVLATPGIAAADTNEAIAETGGVSLALLGSGFTVDVGLDDFGNIATVVVTDPTAPPPDPEATPDGEADDADHRHRIHFESFDGETRIDVMAKKHQLTSKVKAATLGDLVGPHTWSAVLFPESDFAGETVVPFVIAEDGQILLDPNEIGPLPSGATAAVENGDEDEEGAVVTVVLTWNGYTKILKIKLGVDDDGDEEATAVLKVELRAKDRQRRAGDLGDFVGPQSWMGRLCSGELVTVDYEITEDGSLTEPTLGAPEGIEPTIKIMERGFQIKFGAGEAMLKVRFGETEDGVWDLKVDAKTTEKCKHADKAGERGKKDRTERERDRDGDDDEDDD